MKYNELHRKIKAAGWKKLRSEGSHFYFYQGRQDVPSSTLPRFEGSA